MSKSKKRQESPDFPLTVNIPNKTDCQDITEILLKMALNTITLTLSPLAFLIDDLNNLDWVICTQSAPLFTHDLNKTDRCDNLIKTMDNIHLNSSV
jgi:uncharacterized membrane protein